MSVVYRISASEVAW